MAEKIVEILSGGLSDSRPMVRRESAIALGELGSLAASARPALAKLGEDKDESISQAAKMAIDRIERATNSRVFHESMFDRAMGRKEIR